MPLSDREIAKEHGGADSTGLVWYYRDVLAAMAAARAEEHARCMESLREKFTRDVGEYSFGAIADWLERNPPKGEV